MIPDCSRMHSFYSMDRYRDKTSGAPCASRASRIVLAAVLAAAPVAAQANAGIGYFLIAVPMILLALLPAILLEACVLAPLLPVPPRRALALSSVANLSSSLWGIALAIAVDGVLIGVSGSAGPEPTRTTAIAALVPLFFLTWLIEYRAIARRMTELTRARIARATGAANVLSYAAMIALVWMTLPEHGGMSVRMRTGEAMLAGSGARIAVDEFFDSKGRLPQSSDEAGYPRDAASGSKVVSAIEIREAGVVVMTLAKHDYWPEGGRITFTPAADAGAKTLSWKCRSTLPPKHLPATCRE
jgi:hypothetical protein